MWKVLDLQKNVEVPMKTKYDMMINLSGGFDSTACVYKYLTENPDKRLLVHHCVMKKSLSRINRHANEIKAVDSIVRWLKLNGLNNFDLVKTYVDVTEAEPRLNDMHTVAFNTVQVLSRSKFECQDLTICASKLDFLQRTYPDRVEKRRQLYEIYLPELRFHYPIKEMSRRQVIESLPKDLARLPYWCQAPNQEAGHCGKCYVC